MISPSFISVLRSYCNTAVSGCRSFDMAKSYEEAIKTLNTLQSNAAELERIRSTQDKNRHRSLPDTTAMAERVGITLDDIDKLSVIHVSGTKGKGSTCAFSESILRSFGFRTGFYSSPHLVEVRERIRINGRPLSRCDFSKYFWHCYQLLDDSKAANEGAMPAYFRFLTIMAFHVFLQEKVDVAILEVGIGGQYDCTNIVRNPVVCGVTSLGLDHTSILGNTIDKIAWHKGGIFKSNVPAVTVEQPKDAMDVLEERAKEIGCPLYLAPSLHSYDWNNHEMEIGIPGVQQLLNASLALQLCHFWIKDHELDIKERQSLYVGQGKEETDSSHLAESFPISASMAAGLNKCVWPGRNQKLSGPGTTYYIDGAHTVESIQLCANWYIAEAKNEAESLSGLRVARVLLFNMTGDRKPENLLSCLLHCDFDYAIFCPNVQNLSSTQTDLTSMSASVESQQRRCEEIRKIWLQLLANVSHGDNNLTNNALCDPSAQNKLPASSYSNFGQLTTSHSDSVSMPTAVFSSIAESFAFVSRGRDPRFVNSESGGFKLVPSIKAVDHVQVLCVGSLHLIGNILGLLDPKLND